MIKFGYKCLRLLMAKLVTCGKDSFKYSIEKKTSMCMYAVSPAGMNSWGISQYK